MGFVIVTGASQNHYKSLKQLLSSCTYESISQIIVYDLGLNPESQVELIQFFPNILLKVFDYSKYPSYVNISVNAGEYAWKPIIIREVMQSYESHYNDTILLWCDSGNILPHDLSPCINHIKHNYLYSPTSRGNIADWTHPLSLQYFNILTNSSIMTYTCRNGAICGFNLSSADIRQFICRFAECALQKECIAPEGSDRSNHRQDQAVLTILYYFFMDDHPEFIREESYLSIKIHQDID